MPKELSHYDYLKVSKDAPLEVIRAAYRSLSQKYHPDRNPGSNEAARTMTIINIAYEVLSDPQKRREYDDSLKADERGNPPMARESNHQAPGRSSAQPEVPSQSSARESRFGDYACLFIGLLSGALLGVVVHMTIGTEALITIGGSACAGALIAMRIRMNLRSQQHLYRNSPFRDW